MMMVNNNNNTDFSDGGLKTFRQQTPCWNRPFLEREALDSCELFDAPSCASY